jgi:hypothetical protein
MLERGNLGVRVVTLTIKGLPFNFYAYSSYGRDTSVFHKLEKELDIYINWRDELVSLVFRSERPRRR